MRVQHLRGTTSEWKDIDLIPEAGELVIEECEDGTRRCKIGTGFTRFSELPYIDDQIKAELLLKIADAKEQLEDKVAYLNKNFIAELANIEQELKDITTKHSALTKDYIASDASIKAALDKSIADSVELLRGEIEEIEESSKKAQASVLAEVSQIEADLRAAEKNFNIALANSADELDNTRAELVNEYKIGDATLKTIFNKSINDTIDLLRSEITSLSESSTGANTELQASLTALEDKITRAREDFNGVLTEAITNFNAKCLEINNDYTIRDANIKASLTQEITEAKKLLRDEISSVEALSNTTQILLHQEIERIENELGAAEASFNTTLASLTDIFNTRYIELSNDFISRDANLKATLDKTITEATEQLNNEINTLMEALNNVRVEAQNESARVDAKIEAAEEKFTTKLAEVVSGNEAQHNVLTSDYITRDTNITSQLTAQVVTASELLRNEITLAATTAEAARADLQQELSEAKIKINNIERDFNTAISDNINMFNTIRDELKTDYISRDANTFAILDKKFTESVNVLTQSISTEANNASANLQAESTAINVRIAAIEESHQADLATCISNFEAACTKLATDFATGDATTKAILNKNLVDATEIINNEISLLAQYSSELQSELHSEIARVNTKIEATETALNTVLTEAKNSFEQKHTELTNDYITRDANIKATLTKDLTEAAEQLASKITEVSDNLNVVQTSLQSEVVRLDTEIDTTRKTFEEALSTYAGVVDAKFSESRQDYTTRDTNLKVVLSQNLDKAVENLTIALTERTSTIQTALQTETARIDTKITAVEEQFTTDLTEYSKNLNNKFSEVMDDYISRVANVKAVLTQNLTDTASLLQDKITSIDDNLTEAQSSTHTALDNLATKITSVENTFETTLNAQLNTFDAKLLETTSDYVSRDANTRAILTKNITDTTELLQSEITTVNSRVDTLQTSVQNEVARLDNKVASTEADFENALLNQANTFDSKLVETANDYKFRDANLKAIVDKNLDDSIKLIDSKIDSAIDSAREADNQLLADISQLELSITAATTNLTTLIADTKQEIASDFTTKLIESAASLSVAINKLDTQLNGSAPDSNPGQQAPVVGETTESVVSQLASLQEAIQQLLGIIEDLKSNTNLKFMEAQTEVDQAIIKLQQLDNTLSNKIVELRAELLNKVANLNSVIADINTQVTTTNNRIDANLNKINENTRRINNIIAPEESTLTRDAEVIDIRVGYNGVDHESAGDAVRAIGKDLDELKASLPSYIPSNAVDGLEYIDNQLYLTSKGVQVGDAVTITGGSGTGTGSTSTVRVTNNLPSISFTVAKDTEAWINFTYTSFENEVATGDGTYRIIINDKAIDALGGTIQHGVAKPINVIDYLRNGANSVKVICADQYGSSRSLVYTITQFELRIESTFNSAQIFSDTITFRYKVYGQIDKTAYILVDGTEVSSKTLGANVSGNEITLLIPKQSHGCHKITAYILANNDTVSSNVLEYEIICTEENKNAAILASVYDTEEVTQGDLVSIPYMIYDPTKINADIDLIVYSQVAGDLIEIDKATISVDRAKQTWNTRKYPVGIAVFTISYTYDLYGTLTTITKSHTVKVNALDVSADAEEDSLQLYLTSQGRSNNEQNPAVWSYTQAPNGDKTYETITTTFEGFNWTSNGWMTDASGDTCLRLNGDAKAIINFKPFKEDFKAEGKTIEFEFVVRDVNDRDAIVIDCFDGERGFRATPDTAFLKSSGTEVSCRYKDEERVRVAITIEHSETTSHFVSIYLDGVLSGVQRYADTDMFGQENPLTIKLGSSLCGLDIYNIRIYNKALEVPAVLNNYIADQTVPATKLQLITNNDILDENGKVSYERVKALGQIPIITFTGPMPTYKGDKKKKTTRMKFEDPAHPEMNFDVLLDQIDVQGTSSQFYIRKNWKVKLPESRAHMPGAIPAKVYCIKVDYAEATGTHNTGSANYIETLYDREEVTLPPQKDDPRVRTTIQGFPVILFEKETEDSEPVFSSKGNFNYDKDAENAFGFTDAYKDCGVECWEFCNNTSDPVNFAGEIPADWLEDFEPRYAPKSANFERIEELKEIEELAASGKGTMTDAQRNELAILMRNCIANFKEMHDWVLSTATYTLVDGKRVPITPTALDEPTTYGETTYTEDNEEYRLAKFKYEFNNYFNMHYSSMYYVFTFFALMTDQRAKNLFLTRWKESDGVYRWYPYFYDNDTIFGINNEGALVFDYFHEDTDQLGSSNVFNGQNSVLWHNFRLCFPKEIEDTYSNLRSSNKLTYEKIIDQFVTQGSDKYSEAIYNADADYKYTSMARGHVDHTDEEGNQVTGIDASNLYQVRGTGEQHLRYFIANRLNYCDSKWYAGNYPSDDIFLRIYTPKPADDATQEEIDRINASLAAVPANPAITITPFSDMYAGVRYKSGALQQERLKAGEDHTFSPLNANETFGDTETAIYGAGEISSLGDLSGLYCGVINLSNARKLTELTVGNANPAYYNDNFREISVGSNRLLRYIDLRNCSGLGIAGENPQKTLDLSGCPNIEHIYTEGTNLTSISLPDSGYVKTLHLPASINTLVIQNQKNITDFKVENNDYSKITVLRVENSNLDTNELLDKCRDENGKYTVQRVRLTDIQWGTAEEPLENVDFIKSLFPVYDNDGNLINGIRGIDEKNNNLPDAYLVGTCYIDELSGAERDEIYSHYPYLDIKYNKMTANVTFKQEVDGVEQELAVVPVEGIKSTPGSVPANLVPSVENWPEGAAFTYEHIGWSRSKQSKYDITPPNGATLKEHCDNIESDYLNYLQADALINIERDRTLYPVFKPIRKTYVVTFINPTAPEGSQELAKISVAYGNDADYTSAGYPEPQKLDGASPDFYEFIGWSPKPEAIADPLTCYAQFRLLDNIWYTLGIHDIGEYLDYNNTEKIGHTLNSDGTIYITKYNNYQNSAVLIPNSIEVDNEPYSVTRLGGFANHAELSLIRLPDTLLVLTREAFLKCTNLGELKLPDSLVTMEAFALQGCSRLKELTIPAKLININDAALAQCTNLTSITVAEGNPKYTVVYDGLFDTEAKKLVQGFANSGEVSLDGNTITTLGQYCFSSLPIRSVQIPDSITVISSSAFQDCLDLTDVRLPETLQKLDSMCFFRCKNLTNIELPESLTDITSFAFRECALESVVIPASVSNIGDNAFGLMSSLHTVTFKVRRDTEGNIVVPYIHKNAFAQLSGTEGIVFNVPWAEDYDYNYIDKVYDATTGATTENKIDPTGWGASNFTINYNYIEEEV